MKRRKLTLVAALATPTEDERVLSGLALPYGAPGRTSAGLVRAQRGAVRWPADLRRIKVFDGHDRARPIGYLTALEETADGLVASFRVADTDDGNAALRAALEGVKDALSVELEDVEIDSDDTITAAELIGLALVPVPAFTDARLAAEDTEPAEDDTASDEPSTDDEEEPAVDPEDDSTTTPEVQAARAPAALVATRARGVGPKMTLERAAAHVAAAFRAEPTAASLTAALANLTPTGVNWAAVEPYVWINEVWTPYYTETVWLPKVSKGVLTGRKMVGWKRDITKSPKILPWTGEKTPIGSDASLGYVPVEFSAVLHALGVDIAREFIDWGDESVITTWLQLVSQSYIDTMDAALGTLIQAEATDGGTADDLIAGVTLASQKLKKAGARTSWVAVASDLYGTLLSIKVADAPWWLAGSSSVSLADASASVNSLPTIFEAEELADGTVLAGDTRAVVHYEPRGNPYTARALDIGLGGIDLGVYGYSADFVTDARGLVKVAVGPVTP